MNASLSPPPNGRTTFGDDASEWWLSPVATRLEELRLVAHEERCEGKIANGRHGEAIAARLVADLGPMNGAG